MIGENEVLDLRAGFYDKFYIPKDTSTTLKFLKEGKVVKVTWGTTHVVRPNYDASVEKDLKAYFDRYMTMKVGNFKISNDEITEDGRGSITVHPLKNTTV